MLPATKNAPTVSVCLNKHRYTDSASILWSKVSGRHPPTVALEFVLFLLRN